MKQGWRDTCVKSFFEKYYRISDIVIFIEKMIEEKRIPFQKIVSFFEEKCPSLCYGSCFQFILFFFKFVFKHMQHKKNKKKNNKTIK